MASSDTIEETARAYLRANQGLRVALGISPDASLDPHPLGMGEHNVNFWFVDPANGRRYVLRINVAKQPFHKNQVLYEWNALTALEPAGCAPEPLFLDDSPEAPGKGVLVISFCEGTQLDFDHLRPGDVRCALQLMADAHSAPVPSDSPLFRPSDPLEELFREAVQRIDTYRASAHEDPRITRWAETFLALGQRTLEEVPAPCCSDHIVNTETLPSHFLIPAASAAAAAAHQGSGRFCEHPGAFVDWERPIIGEPAQDVAYFTAPTTTFWDSEFLFPPNQVEGVVEAYWQAVDGRFPRACFDERFRAYRIMTSLKSTAWCCQALLNYEGSSAAHRTAKTASKLSTYLSDEFMEQVLHNVTA